MVKKTKKQFVWQEPKPKVRKARTKREKVEEIEEVQGELEDIEEGDMNGMRQEEKPQQIVQQAVQAQYAPKEMQSMAQPEPQALMLPSKLTNEEARKELNARLAIIKQILYSEQYADSNNSSPYIDNYRQFQCQEILSFLNEKDQKTAQSFQILCKSIKQIDIYGTPGIGKTFTMKRMLAEQRWEGRVKWINCLTMLSKSLLRYVEPCLETQEKNRILVIDEFDQMEKQFRNIRFIHSFKAYLKEVLTKSFISNIADIRFVLISNKSYQSISNDFIQSFKNLIKFDSIIEVPFLPYTPSDVFRILKLKAEAIHKALNTTIFTDSFLQLTSKRQFSKSQDIRKVINYVFTNLQTKQLKKLTDKNERKGQSMGEERSLEADVIVNMTGRQKGLFKSLLENYEKFQEKEEPLLAEFMYNEGSKCGIARGTVDLWLTEWAQMSLLSLRNFQKYGHHMHKTKQIRTHLSFKELRRYFY